MIKKCIGCGSALQSNDPLKKGYVKDLITKNMVYCERCFKLKNYHQFSNIPLDYSNDSIINKVNKKAQQVLFCIDLLNINNETINTFKKIKVKKYLVITKLDIIPKSFYLKKIKEQLKEIYDICDPIIFISALKSLKLGEITNILKLNETYILGFTNSGKSTLINTLFNDSKIVTSNMINTTLDFIKLVNDEITVYDSPGFQYNKLFTDNLDYINNATMKTVIKPVTYQLKAHSALFVNEIAIYNNNDKTTSVTFYMPILSKIKRIYDILDIKGIKYNFNDDDLIIKGLGFINFKNSNDIYIDILDQDVLEVRKSIFR